MGKLNFCDVLLLVATVSSAFSATVAGALLYGLRKISKKKPHVEPHYPMPVSRR